MLLRKANPLRIKNKTLEKGKGKCFVNCFSKEIFF